MNSLNSIIRYFTLFIVLGIRVAQLEEAWAVDHAVGRSISSCVKLTKSFQQASNPKIACFLD